MIADRFRPRTSGSQGHKFTSSTSIYQSINQTRNEAPTLIPPRVKNSNLGIYNTVIQLCAEVPHKLPKGRRPKPIKLLLSSGCKAPRQLVVQYKRSPVSYTGTPADIIIMVKHFCIYFHCPPLTCCELRKGYFRFYFSIGKNGLTRIHITLK